MRTDDILKIAETVDDAGYYSLECWGGATFDVCMRFLRENPWERLRQIKKVCRKTPLQMLFRGQNILGYKHYPDDIVERFAALACENGMDIFRIFDALNDPRNLEQAIRSVKKYGGHAQGTISYTTSPVHTVASYVKLAKAQEAMGVDSLCIKDMAGILTPGAARELVGAFRKALPEMPIQVHSHMTSGMAAAMYMAAVEAGGVDTAGAGATYSIAWPLILSDAQLWQVAAGDTVSLATDDLLQLGGKTWYVNNADNGVLRLDGAAALPNNMVVSNGWLEARGDESLGSSSGTTTFELYNSSGRKGKLRILPEEGKNEVSFHRNVTFHYQKCSEWGDFMTLPANCTVNFYGKMSTSSTGCEGNPWPCHWRYTCPSTTVVHWWGTMHAALNHHFPGGTHYVHSPLSGGDRFNVSKGVVVELLAANNSIGAATGDFQGKMYCRVPYALNAGSADRLLSFNGGTLDLCGGDQSLSLIHCTSDNTSAIYSEEPAFMRLTRNKVVTTGNPAVVDYEGAGTVPWCSAPAFFT